jgi:hypothetical protein
MSRPIGKKPFWAPGRKVGTRQRKRKDDPFRGPGRKVRSRGSIVLGENFNLLLFFQGMNDGGLSSSTQ